MLLRKSWTGSMRRTFPRAPDRRRQAPVPLLCEPLEDRSLPSGGYLLIADLSADCVRRYDGATGAFVDVFVPKGSGGMNQPWGVLFGPLDHNLYVSTGEFGPQIKAVLRYDGTTGAFNDNFAKRGNLRSPRGIIFGPEGDLYVADRDVPSSPYGRVVRYDGRTGAYKGDFVSLASGGLSIPKQIVFGPSVEDPNRLDLYVVSQGTSSVLRYHGTSGAFLEEFVVRGSGGLRGPVMMTFGPDGNLYVGDFYGGDAAVKRFQGPLGSSPGEFIDTFVPAGSGGILSPSGILFGPDGNGDGKLDLYVAGVNEDTFDDASVLRYDGLTGDFIDVFVAQGSGGLVDAAMITFTETNPVTLAYDGGVPVPPAVPPYAAADTIFVDQAQPLASLAYQQTPDQPMEFQVTEPMAAQEGGAEDRVAPANQLHVRTAHENTTRQNTVTDAAGLGWIVFDGSWESA